MSDDNRRRPHQSDGPRSGSPRQPGSAQQPPASDGPEQPGSAGRDQDLAGRSGPDLARAVLDAARARRQAQGGNSRRTGRGSSGATQGGAQAYRRRGRRGYTGPGPDPRDPQLLSVVMAKLIKDRGWRQPAAEGAVFGAWDRVVGAEIAAKCRPVKLDDCELTVEAVSTAWATQLRLLAGKVVAQIAAEVGPNVVKRIRVHGPAAPSWRHGPRRVQGRGPGDTYG
ncbi:MAG: DUF721 domain-containing protein [Micromonosporaceae bacterium]